MNKFEKYWRKLLFAFVQQDVESVRIGFDVSCWEKQLLYL